MTDVRRKSEGELVRTLAFFCSNERQMQNKSSVIKDYKHSLEQFLRSSLSFSPDKEFIEHSCLQPFLNSKRSSLDILLQAEIC